MTCIIASLDGDLCGYGWQNKGRITKMNNDDDDDNDQSVRCDEGGGCAKSGYKKCAVIFLHLPTEFMERHDTD